MDYEKAYKESFEAAKGLHDAGNALTKKQMEIVFPQLAESEDERIRKWIHKYIAVRLDDAGEFIGEYREALAWLEKQKEQKPAEWSEEDRHAIENCEYAIKETFKDEQNPHRIGTLDWLKNLSLSLKKKNEDVAKLCSNEWSEEDSRMLSDIAGYISGVGSSSGITKRERVDFLYELPKRFNLQPKQEWSEEDEKMLEGTIMWLDDLEKQGEYVEKERLWLKSLRPQPKQEWSEEDSEMMMRIINQVGGYTYFAGMDSERVVNWLKSLRPVSKESLQSWKPNEEQMKALLGAEGISRASGYPDNAKVLASLYEQLKKL